MKANRIWRRLTVAVVAVTLLVAGCDGGSSETTGAGGVRLTWWAWNVAEGEKVVAAFEKEHPDIDVELRPYGYDDYLKALRPALTSGNGPDVFQLQPGGLVVNYEPLAVDLAPLAEGDLGQDWRSRFHESGLAQLAVDDKQVALPSIMSAAGLVYYNKAVLDQAKVTVPRTFDEWTKVCTAVVATGRQCLAHGAKDAWANLDLFLSIVNSDEPGLVYDAIAGKTAWDSPALVTAAGEFARLFDGRIIAKGAASRAEYPDAFNDFVAGKAAFIALGTWNTAGTMTKTGLAASAEGISGKPSGPFFSAPFPAAQAGKEPTGLFGGPDNGWAVSAQSKHPDEASALVMFLSSGGGQQIQAALANFPAVVDVPVDTKDVVVPAQVADITEQQTAIGTLVGARQIPYPDLEAALGQALSQVIAKPSAAKDALAEVEKVSAGLTR